MSSPSTSQPSHPPTGAGEAIVLLADDGVRLLLDAESVMQAVYLYQPVFDADGRIVDLSIVMVNEAARRVMLSEHIVEGVYASEVFVDMQAAIDAANEAWNGGSPPSYHIERRGFHEGQHQVVHYEVSTMRAASYIVQVSADHTVVELLASADARFKLMAEAAVDGLMLLTPLPEENMLVEYANPAALAGEPDIVVGRPLPFRLIEVVRSAVQELTGDDEHPRGPVRRFLQRDVLARHVSVEATFTAVGDGRVMVSLRELTTQEMARAELERSDRVLRAIGAGAFGTIAVYEPYFQAGRLVDLHLLWSAAGHGQGASHRAPLDPTSVLTDQEVLEMARSMLHSGEPTRSGWVPVVGPHGEERSVEFTLVLAGDRFVLEFVERTEELNARTALAMVTATAEAQRNFLSRVSHELRTPLNVIHGYSQLLSHLRLPEPASAHVEHIESGVDRMVSIIEDLLLLGQLDQGLVRIDDQAVDVADVAMDVMIAAQKEPWFDADRLQQLPGVPVRATVTTDPSRLALMALLVAEASLASSADAVVQVGSFSRGTRAGLQLVTRSDSPVVNAVWSPFVKSHTIPGSGLGLAVARSLAKALDVMVEVRAVADDPTRTALVLLLTNAG